MNRSIYILITAVLAVCQAACSQPAAKQSQAKQVAPVKPSYDQHLGKTRRQLVEVFGKPTKSLTLTRNQLKDELRQPLLRRLPSNIEAIFELQFAVKTGVLHVWLLDDANGNAIGDAFVPTGVVF